MLVGVDWGGTKIEAIAIADEGELSQDCGRRHHGPTTRLPGDHLLHCEEGRPRQELMLLLCLCSVPTVSNLVTKLHVVDRPLAMVTGPGAGLGRCGGAAS
jgi:hypothetical protein